MWEYKCFDTFVFLLSDKVGKSTFERCKYEHVDRMDPKQPIKAEVYEIVSNHNKFFYSTLNIFGRKNYKICSKCFNK